MYIFIATTNKKNTQKREMMDGAGKSCTVDARINVLQKSKSSL
jgi:hypothetical protein